MPIQCHQGACGGNVGGADQVHRVLEGQAADATHKLGPVNERQSLFCFQDCW